MSRKYRPSAAIPGVPTGAAVGDIIVWGYWMEGRFELRRRKARFMKTMSTPPYKVVEFGRGEDGKTFVVENEFGLRASADPSWFEFTSSEGKRR